MGKYMRKAKGAGEVAVMEVSSQSSLGGVRTRARTRTLLALQNQTKKASATPNSKPPNMCIEPPPINTSSYLELRSRKLEKSTGPCCAVAAQETHLKKMGKLYCSGSERSRNERQERMHSHSAFMVSKERQPKRKGTNLSSLAKKRSIHSGSRGSPSAVSNSTSFSQVCSKRKSVRAQRKEQVKKPNNEIQNIVPQSSIRSQGGQLQVYEDETPTPIEGSFGENAIDQEGRDRHMRESTPSSLIGDGETLEAPGSTTRPSCRSSGRRRLQGGNRRDVPTSREMEEFFAGAEQQQQRFFIERYNYDPVNDLPLPGRYEWVGINTAGFRP